MTVRPVAVSTSLSALLLPWWLETHTGIQGHHLWDRVAAAEACSSRTVLWSNVAHLIAQKPWVGWGWGELDYAHFITLYPGARFCDILDNAHNLPLHLAVELGLPLALLLCGGALWLIWRARPWREIDATRQLAWAVLAVIVLHSLLEYPLWYGPFQMAAGLCVWLLLPAGAQWRRTLAPYVQASLSGMLLTFCALDGWQYHLASQIYLPTEQRAPAYRFDTLEKTRHVLLFQEQVRFAELTLTELTPANAAPMNRLAKEILHFSPEARVVEIIIDSARLLGREAEADFYLARLQAAFPQAHADWQKTHGH